MSSPYVLALIFGAIISFALSVWAFFMSDKFDPWRRSE